MKIKCPFCSPFSLENHASERPDSGRCVKKGTFFRKEDSRWIQKFLCLTCRKSFSSSTLHPCYRQKRRRINAPLLELLSSATSIRRAAYLLRVSRGTVERRLTFLASQASVRNQRLLEDHFGEQLVSKVQFDDLETYEHTRLKPLSVCAAVEQDSRLILGFQVSSMPASGTIAKRARAKYGYRTDDRGRGWRQLMDQLKSVVSPTACFRSDSHPRYPIHLKRAFPHAQHIQEQSRRACVAGYGELKEGGYDPLFPINHTFAMMRANMSRLLRRTWCTTKKPERLIMHLAIYTYFHNRRILAFR